MLFVVVAANMRAFLQSYLGRNSLRLLLSVLVVAASQVCRGEDLSLQPLAPSGEEPQWLLGPGKANLKDFGILEVPEGYRFTDAKGARIILQRMKKAVSPNLVGFLAPDSGKFWAILEFTDLGYVKDLDKSTEFDAAATLEAVRARIGRQNQYLIRAGAAPITSVDWAIQPVFDPDRYTLAWALRAETRSEKVVNQTVRLLGRRGALDIVAVQRDQGSFEPAPLLELAKNISFNPGERYADYQRGDKLATVGLVALIAGEENTTTGRYMAKVGIWAGVVFLAGALAGVVVVIRRMRQSQKNARAYPTGRDPGLASLFHNGNGANGGDSAARRKKMFNYHKFYSDMMLQVSSGPTALMPATNGRPVARETNGRVYPRETVVNQAIVHANLELIANQTNLIEEQKRLLQEQSKLIEEKSRLIREKNEVLEKQAELFERDLL
jgi:uncharacterized membrane-anchored protein